MTWISHTGASPRRDLEMAALGTFAEASVFEETWKCALFPASSAHVGPVCLLYGVFIVTLRYKDPKDVIHVEHPIHLFVYTLPFSRKAQSGLHEYCCWSYL